MADLLAPYSGPWTRVQARHLLRRAGFGLPLTRVDELVALGREKAVASLLASSMEADGFEEPDWIPAVENLRELREEMQMLDETERRKARQEVDRENRQAIQRMILWWMKRMYESPAVLREKMTLFWHGHFAVSAQKVKVARYNYDMNRTLRANALGKFAPLVEAVAKSPAMIRYLDNDRNVKGKPNENFARELMELFTIGIGNYTESDIKEAARAFTGWAFDGTSFTFRARRHDDGRKKFMGREGAFRGEDIIRIILEQEEVARFIAGKVWAYFAYENPEPEIVEGLAARFRGSRYDIADLLAAVFNSAAFYAPRAVWTQIKSPVAFLIALHGELDTSTPRQALIVQSLQLLGQTPFYPPNVKGWDHGRAWINSNTLLLRANLANYLVNGLLPELRNQPRRTPAARRAAGGGDTGAMAEQSMAEQSMSDDDSMMMDEQEAEPTIRAQKTRPPLDLPEFLAAVGAGQPSELVTRCVDRFIGHPVSPDQMDALRGTVASVKNLAKPASMSAADQDKVRAMLHLLLSTAEYQLC